MRIESAGAGAAAAAAEGAKNPKLVNAAQQFESMLLQEMLKPMRGGGEDSWGGDDQSNKDSAMDTISSYGTEAIATAISRQREAEALAAAELLGSMGALLP